VYKVLHELAPQYLGPLNYVADLPGRRPFRSAGINRLAVPPVKLTTVTRQRDICRVVVHLLPASQDLFL